MHEYVANLHMHTRYSDGYGLHKDIAQAALAAGIDIVFVTDHNVLVQGPEGYYREGDRRVLLLIGQEVHDQARLPQKNHMLVLGADRDVAQLAYEPQRLVDNIRQAGGLSFLAHPADPAAPAIGEEDLGWVSWDLENFTGLEIWNALSELKARLKTRLHAFFYINNPEQVARGPFDEVLQKWDELLMEGKRIVGIGGSDAHAIPVKLGPFKWTVFPYQFHFRAVNTHLLVPDPLTGDTENDGVKILNALRKGNAFVGYDLPASTRGFRFTAQGENSNVWMGDQIELNDGVTFQIRLPVATHCQLIRNGQVVKNWENRPTCTYITTEPGVYRVEAFIDFRGRRRGWIFSNPIYVQTSA
ncbi:MAG: CehA/McbA family metallohydrolase [Anaerolineales bacterium]